MTNISLSVLYGGPDSEVIEPVIRNLKNRIKQLNKSYSDSIENIKFTLCISGSIHNYKNKSGIDNFKYESRYKRFNVGWVIPKNIWAKGNGEVTNFLRQMISETCKSIESTCSKKEIHFNVKDFEKDFKYPND